MRVTLSPEEWLYELWKRYQFKQGEIGLPHSIHMLSTKEQEKYFLEFIFDKQIEKLLTVLQPAPPQPIRYPSISDVFLMYHMLINTDWYKKHLKREEFEGAIAKIIDKGTLSREQKVAFHEMYNAPWCVFNENHEQDSWCPKKDMIYLSGIPLSVDPGYSKEDTVTIFKKKLNAWVGKVQSIELQFDRWQESKILAVFDLMLWFKIQRIEYSNISLHNLIWPNGRISKSTGLEVNPYDDIDHSIMLANRVIDQSPISSLLIMCEARKYKKETAPI